MDTELAHTFLAVVMAGSFAEAAEKLCVTQSTVSARIQRLEQQLGARLFIREKSGSVLTSAGKRFQRHAIVLTRTVENARQDAGTASGFRDHLAIGGRLGLWEGLLTSWLAGFVARMPDVSIRSFVGFEEDLMQALIDGRMDIAVMYTPQVRPGLEIERLFDDHLVMVSTHPTLSSSPGPDYVHVDWGPEFLTQHQRTFPAYSGSRLIVNMGWLGVEYLMHAGGTGYFPLRTVQAHVSAGRLHRVPAPAFLLPAYMCYSAREDSGAFQTALESLRHVATLARGELA